MVVKPVKSQPQIAVYASKQYNNITYIDHIAFHYNLNPPHSGCTCEYSQHVIRAGRFVVNERVVWPVEEILSATPALPPSLADTVYVASEQQLSFRAWSLEQKVRGRSL